MKTTKFVYIASPYAGLSCARKERHYVAKRIALKECEKIRKAGFIPLSPILAFDGIYDEERDRESVLLAGMELLLRCDYIHAAKHPDSPHSPGMKAELEYAKKNGILEIEIELFGGNYGTNG